MARLIYIILYRNRQFSHLVHPLVGQRMIDHEYPVIFSFVTFQYSVVHHAERQRWTVVRLVVEIRRDPVFAEYRADNVFLCERRYLFGGLWIDINGMIIKYVIFV